MGVILVTLPDGQQVAVEPQADGTARVMHREESWFTWSPPFGPVPEGSATEHVRGTYTVRPN
jgi:hypothetical protein